MEESSTSTLICDATTGNISLLLARKHPDRGRSIRLRDLLPLVYRSYDITTINQKHARRMWVESHPLIRLMPETLARTHVGDLCKSCMAPSCVRHGSRTVKSSGPFVPLLLVLFWTHSCTPESPLRLTISKPPLLQAHRVCPLLNICDWSGNLRLRIHPNEFSALSKPRNSIADILFFFTAQNNGLMNSRFVIPSRSLFV